MSCSLHLQNTDDASTKERTWDRAWSNKFSPSYCGLKNTMECTHATHRTCIPCWIGKNKWKMHKSNATNKTIHGKYGPHLLYYLCTSLYTYILPCIFTSVFGRTAVDLRYENHGHLSTESGQTSQGSLGSPTGRDSAPYARLAAQGRTRSVAGANLRLAGKLDFVGIRKKRILSKWLSGPKKYFWRKDPGNNFNKAVRFC